MSPSEAENFDITHISLSLSGIGAQLIWEDGYTKIKELIAGGPAESGQRDGLGRDRGIGADQAGDCGEQIHRRREFIAACAAGYEVGIRVGEFLGCSGYPECRSTRSLDGFDPEALARLAWHIDPTW